MKELRYILAVLFSSLIIIAGGDFCSSVLLCPGCPRRHKVAALPGCSKCIPHTHRSSKETITGIPVVQPSSTRSFETMHTGVFTFVPSLHCFAGDNCRCLITPCHKVACMLGSAFQAPAICRRFASLSGALFHASHLVLFFYTGNDLDCPGGNCLFLITSLSINRNEI